MSDFSLKIYTSLLEELKNRSYDFQIYLDFLQKSSKNSIILRHDVDLMPKNSLRFAQIQYNQNIRGTYYFRSNSKSWDANFIKRIAGLNHEIGYHYETMDTANGNIDLAWDQFRYNLDKLREVADIKTICMHGSPRSRFDNGKLWEKYDYRSLGIIGEPYFDTNFDEVLYLTDTGRRWDGWRFSVRDKVSNQFKWNKNGLIFHSTKEIIVAAIEDRLPNKIMFTFHPQRWSDQPISWLKELVFQNIKNQIKRFITK